MDGKTGAMDEVQATRGQRTRRAILSGGEALFLERGYIGTSMDKVAEHAGVTKQTVYSHVESKEALFLLVVDGMTGEAGDKLAEMVADPNVGSPADLPPESFLQDFAEQQLEIVLTPRLMQLRRMVIGEAARFPELGALLHKRGPGRSIGRLARALKRYADTHALTISDAREAAAVFNWLVMGGPVNDAMLLGDSAIPSPVDKKRHATECVRIFTAAYAANTARPISRTIPG